MPISIDAESRVSEELSELIEALLDAGTLEEPVTLGAVRDKLKEQAAASERAPDRRIGSEETLFAEVERLIEEYGEDAAAADLMVVKASEQLSEVIEALIDEAGEEVVPTLGSIREALEQGRGAHLEGAGLIEPDEEQTLLAELDALIARYGADTAAEEVLRFE